MENKVYHVCSQSSFRESRLNLQHTIRTPKKINVQSLPRGPVAPDGESILVHFHMNILLVWQTLVEIFHPQMVTNLCLKSVIAREMSQFIGSLHMANMKQYNKMHTPKLLQSNLSIIMELIWLLLKLEPMKTQV